MTIEQKHDDGKVMFIKLQSGDDLIAHAYDIPADTFDQHHMMLYNPMKLVYTITQTGIACLLMPWIMGHIVPDQSFKVYTVDVVTTGIPSDNMVKNYYEILEKLEAPKQQASIVSGVKIPKEKIPFIHDPYDDESEKFIDEEESEEEQQFNDIAEEFYKDKKKTIN